MGIFFKSLSKELGKNTGKYISNKIFGDSHATPYKVIRQEEREERRLEKEKIKLEKSYLKALETEERQKKREEIRRGKEEEIRAKGIELEKKRILREDKKTQKEAEIEYNRWLKEQRRIEKIEQEADSIIERLHIEKKNQCEINAFNQYIESLIKIHTNSSFEINWDKFICENDNFIELFKETYKSNLYKNYSTLSKEYAIMHLCWQIAEIDIDTNTKSFISPEEEKQWHNIIKDQSFNIELDEIIKVLRLINDNTFVFDRKWLFEQCIDSLHNQPLYWKLKTIMLLKQIANATNEDDRNISIKESDFIYEVINSFKLPDEIALTSLICTTDKEPEIINLCCYGDFDNLEIDNLSDERPTSYDEKFLIEYPKKITSSQYEIANYSESDNIEIQRFLELLLLANKDAKSLLNNWNETWKNAFKLVAEKAQMHEIAKGICQKNKNFYYDALTVYPIYDIVNEYGSSVNIDFFEEGAEIDIFLNIDEVIPLDKKILNRQNDISIKPYTNTERNLLIQDYICSMILRITRETFNLFYFDNIIVNAIQNEINKSNGKNEDITIVSVLIERSLFQNINLEKIDPSDCLSQIFHCRINFNKSKGFIPVDNLIFKGNHSKIENKPIIDGVNSKIKGSHKMKKNNEIIINSSMTVLDLKTIIKKLYKSDVNILTNSGNIAGENRKLKALSNKEFKQPFKKSLINLDLLIVQIKNDIGITITINNKKP
jgi:hypothetical protein